MVRPLIVLTLFAMFATAQAGAGGSPGAPVDTNASAATGTAAGTDSIAAPPADSAAAADSTDSSAVGTCFFPFLADSSLVGADLDTTVHHLRGMIRACEIRGEQGWWAVDYFWFTLQERPGELFDMAGLDSLGALGVINLDARVTLVPLRLKLYAPTLDWLKSSAEGHRPAHPPQFMIEAVREAGRSQAGSRQ